MPQVLMFVVVMAAFVVLDVTWLSLAGGAILQRQLGPLLRTQPDLVVAAAFYVIYAAGMVALVVAPEVRAGTARSATLRGAMLGLTAYATFDLTALSVINGWTALAAFTDLAWGTLATAIACALGQWVMSRYYAPSDGRR